MKSKHVVIGTAGHIDHGKTELVKYLTNIDTDRLEEEKRRGITIDLGFAYLDLPSGQRLAIVDVPGHERFIKNMLAGATGMDMVLLVIAADEGVMPQTEEHFHILKYLGLTTGIVVLTKCDFVDQEWLELIKKQVSELVKDSFLENAQVIATSTKTGEGMDALKTAIEELAQNTTQRKMNGPSRLPIDRVFTVTGLGTVVTGTLTEGSLSLGETLEVFPKGLEAKVRGLQVHGQPVEVAYPGQRVAVNIGNLKKHQLNRGDTLGAVGSLKPTQMVDLTLKVLENYPRTLENWTRLRLYAGTAEVMCRLVLLDRQSLKGGESAVVQLRLESPSVFKHGDKGILRLFSPLETVGGGVVLDPNATKHKRFSEAVLTSLYQSENASTASIAMEKLQRMSEHMPTASELALECGIEITEVERILRDKVACGEVIQIQNAYLHEAFVSELEERLLTAVGQFHLKNPLKIGISKEELRTRVFKASKVKFFDELLNIYFKKDMINMIGQLVALRQFDIVLSKTQVVMKERLVKTYYQSGYGLASSAEVLKTCGFSAKDQALLDYVLQTGELVKLDEGLMIHSIWLGDARSKLLAYLENHDYIELGRFRDLLGTSRKVAVAILEYFDTTQLTVRDNLLRRLK